MGKSGISCLLLRTGDFISQKVIERIIKTGIKHNINFETKLLGDCIISELGNKYDVIVLDPGFAHLPMEVLENIYKTNTMFFQLTNDDLVISKIDGMVYRLLDEIA